MKTIYVYEADNYNDHIANKTKLNAPVDQFSAQSNDDCEKWAEENYGDTDNYTWSYTKWN